MKNILIIFLSFFLLLGFHLPLFAQDSLVVDDDSSKSMEVNSFELFWPVVAGKTKGDSLYGLKLFKEKLRGFLIFGEPQKANYNAFLATKRLVEAEKLIKGGKDNFSDVTLDKMMGSLVKVEENVDIANNKGGNYNDVGIELIIKLENIETFTRWLIDEQKSNGDKLNLVIDKTTSILSKLR